MGGPCGLPEQGMAPPCGDRSLRERVGRGPRQYGDGVVGEARGVQAGVGGGRAEANAVLGGGVPGGCGRVT